MKFGRDVVLALCAVGTLGAAAETVGTREKLYPEDRAAEDAIESFFKVLDLEMSLSTMPSDNPSAVPTKRPSQAPGKRNLTLHLLFVA